MPPQIINAVATAAGAAVALFSASGGIRYAIQQIAVSTTGATGTAQVLLNNQFILGTSQGWLDSADGPPSIDLAPGDQLKVVWANAGAGASCTAVLLGEQYP
jgi:hypothetical protein